MPSGAEVLRFSRHVRERDALSYDQSLTSRLRVTTRHLCEDDLRHEHVVLCTTARSIIHE
jgi:hypothetical protein